MGTETEVDYQEDGIPSPSDPESAEADAGEVRRPKVSAVANVGGKTVKKQPKLAYVSKRHKEAKKRGVLGSVNSAMKNGRLRRIADKAACKNVSKKAYDVVRASTDEFVGRILRDVLCVLEYRNRGTIKYGDVMKALSINACPVVGY